MIKKLQKTYWYQKYLCFSVKQNEVNDYLNAADYAMMIRKKRSN